MSHRRRVGLCFFLALGACRSTPVAAPVLMGEWAPRSAELGGQPFPVESFRGATLRLTEKSYEFGIDKGSYYPIPSTAPAQMDIGGSVGPNAGRTIHAIYELTAERLTICYQLGPGERPTSFESPKDSQVLLVRYERVSDR